MPYYSSSAARPKQCKHCAASRPAAVAAYEEHAATQAAIAAITSARARLAGPGASAPLALCAGLTGYPYSLGPAMSAFVLQSEGYRILLLGPAMSAFVLQSEGYRILLLGPDTSANQVIHATRANRPALLAVSVGAAADESQLIDDVAAISEAAQAGGALLALGGRGLDRPLRARLLADFFGDTMTHLAAFARRVEDSSRS